ncbi:MAG TPA: GNAT family protein [Candidatus Pacearchaeota archaeon]|nr:GNAT family protein [Candidatus Pacearchaeota archaeon]
MLKKIKTKKGKEVCINYLCQDDTKDLLELYNSLVDEKSYTVAAKKLTLGDEKIFIKESLKKIEKGDAIFLVAEYADRVIGIASITKEDSKLMNHRGDFGIILSKEIRGEGVGTELMECVIKEAKKFLKIKIVTLHVFEENIVAINLYKKLDFIQVGKIEKGLKHFGKYKNEVIMAKYI